MWLADRWKDYEVIDCSCGEKLERWSKYILLRPDPQVIWDTPKTNKNWKKLNGHYHRSKKGGGEWEFFDLPQEWTINYSLPINKELTFHLKPFSFKHTSRIGINKEEKRLVGKELCTKLHKRIYAFLNFPNFTLRTSAV